MRDLDRPLDGGARFAILTDRTPTRCRCCGIRRRTSSPRRCASSAPAPASASGPPSTTASTTTSRSPRPFTPEDLEAIETARWRKVVGREYPVRARGGRSRDEANRRFADDPLKLERIGELGRRRDDLRLHGRAVHRPLPRPARARHGRLKHFKLLTRRGRLLARRRASARCCSASTARPSSRRTSSTRTCTASRRRGSATTACWGRSSTCSCSIRSSPGAAFWTDRGTTMYNTLNELHARAAARRLPGDQDAAAVQQGALGAVGALGQVPREHVPRARQRDGRARHVAQADELSVAPPALSHRRSTRIASCRCATSPSTCCTATRSPVRCRGSRACGSSSRTTATST